MKNRENHILWAVLQPLYSSEFFSILLMLIVERGGALNKICKLQQSKQLRIIFGKLRNPRRPSDINTEYRHCVLFYSKLLVVVSPSCNLSVNYIPQKISTVFPLGFNVLFAGYVFYRQFKILPNLQFENYSIVNFHKKNLKG